MATLGPNDLKQYALPTYWDAAEVEKVRLQSGETYAQYIADVSQALAAVNAGLLSAEPYAGMISTTTDMIMEYPIGTSNGFQVATEYGRPDAKRGATTGHMLPLISYDRGLGWTWMFLQKARRAQLDADIAAAITDVRNKYEQLLLTRLFKSTYDAIGTSGRSMPIADGGTADSTYCPPHVPNRESSTFSTSHTHLGRQDGITQTTLEVGVAHVWEHGFDGPFELLVSLADLGSWTNTTNVTGYVPRPDPLIQYGTTQDVARVGSDVFGVINTDYGACRLRASARIPTKYWAVFKSFGASDARNPLVLRYNPKFGIGAVLLSGDHIREYPLENAIMWMEMGVGIRDRVSAYICYNHDDNAYTDPTIS